MRFVDHDPHRTALLDGAVRALLGRVRGTRWLDAGCGEGRLARALARRGASVLGVDVAPGLVASARRRARTLPDSTRARLRFVTAGLAARGHVAAGSLDGVLASLALMHVARVEGALAAWARALKPGGRLVLVLPHPCFMGPGTSWAARLPQVPRGAPVLEELRVADYPPEGAQRFRFDPSFPAPTVNYHRSLETMQEALAAHGFLTRRLREPRPTAARAATDPAWEARRRVPFFLLWEALRVAL
ncbi:MAG: class I SAM-dependent methyltransferase [Candidatus Eisenbacteria bacterium]